jgi:hypothetical protein
MGSNDALWPGGPRTEHPAPRNYPVRRADSVPSFQSKRKGAPGQVWATQMKDPCLWRSRHRLVIDMAIFVWYGAVLTSETSIQSFIPCQIA